MLEFAGRQIETDAQGYLLNSSDWSEELVPLLATEEGIELSEAHWEVVRFVREFYMEFNTSPAIRMLVKAMTQKYGEEKEIAAIYIAYFLKAPPNKPLSLRVCQNR